MGTQKFKPIDIKGEPERTVRKGYNVTTKIFGIPYKAVDEVTRKLKLNEINDRIERYPDMDIYNAGVKVKHHYILVKFYFSFVQQTVIKDYYTFQDIIQELGGLAKVASGAIASAAIVFTVLFMKDLVF